jgi:hypothetical protein
MNVTAAAVLTHNQLLGSFTGWLKCDFTLIIKTANDWIASTSSAYLLLHTSEVGSALCT